MSEFILKGRWHGELYAPDRHFQGTVEVPGPSALQVGDRVTVTFVEDRPTVHCNPTQLHGHFSLDGMPREDFVLVSFVRKDGEVGADATQDGDAQRWGGDLFIR
ncbi:hypothetical protein [Deinococcus ruber]|uniref:Uncharacterized protein n=1 Tax=Deinococcus ruber TaxID=1848197 RepID=A0A918F981_9DEIO|nr:hypothetical protein [Deinococcus ruber]GGR13211.1 hypothetical protein GCM10008957_27710 [Deinococcus ruber]